MHEDKNDLGIVCGLFLFVLMTMMLVASIHDGTSTSPPCKSANCFNISLNYSELIEQDTALNRTLNEHIGEHTTQATPELVSQHPLANAVP